MCLRLGDRLHIDVAAAALPPLPAMVEVVAYRIVVESVTNAVRHASARRCDVAFAHGSGTDLLVTVTDDGVGLPEPLRSGAGVRSMRERADEVGGTITFTANRPTGTVVHARLPLGSP
jgi:signal transduction histidine kinase